MKPSFKFAYLFLIISCSFSIVTVHAGDANSAEKVLRVMTVVICQQDDFLQYVLAPYLAEKDIRIEYRQGHHSEVAKAVANKEADFVITHTKVKALQKMEKKELWIFIILMPFLGM